MDKILRLHQKGMDKLMNKKYIVALFGAAGAGKDTIQKEIVKQSPYLCHEIISSTTRPPREYEQDYVDYHFISDAESQKYLDNGDYLEYAEFRGSSIHRCRRVQGRMDRLHPGSWRPCHEKI